MPSVLTGLLAGPIATVVMAVFATTMGGDSPPPAALRATYVGDEAPASYVKQGTVLHAVHGIGGEAAFGATALALDVGTGALVGSVLRGVAFGLVLTIGGTVFWMRIVLATEPDPKTAGTFGFFHLVYDVVLGAGVAILPV